LQKQRYQTIVLNLNNNLEPLSGDGRGAADPPGAVEGPNWRVGSDI